MILGLMEGEFFTLSSLSFTQFSRWVIDVDQEMSLLNDLWELCGGFVLWEFFFSFGNWNGFGLLQKVNWRLKNHYLPRASSNIVSSNGN